MLDAVVGFVFQVVGLLITVWLFWRLAFAIGKDDIATSRAPGSTEPPWSR